MASISEKALAVQRKRGAFGVAGAAEEKRGRGPIKNARDAKLAVHRFETGNPETGRFVILLCFLFIVAIQIFSEAVAGLLAVAMVSPVIEPFFDGESGRNKQEGAGKELAAWTPSAITAPFSPRPPSPLTCPSLKPLSRQRFCSSVLV